MIYIYIYTYWYIYILIYIHSNFGAFEWSNSGRENGLKLAPKNVHQESGRGNHQVAAFSHSLPRSLQYALATSLRAYWCIIYSHIQPCTSILYNPTHRCKVCIHIYIYRHNITYSFALLSRLIGTSNMVSEFNEVLDGVAAGVAVMARTYEGHLGLGRLATIHLQLFRFHFALS